MAQQRSRAILVAALPPEPILIRSSELSGNSSEVSATFPVEEPVTRLPIEPTARTESKAEAEIAVAIVEPQGRLIPIEEPPATIEFELAQLLGDASVNSEPTRWPIPTPPSDFDRGLVWAQPPELTHAEIFAPSSGGVAVITPPPMAEVELAPLPLIVLPEPAEDVGAWVFGTAEVAAVQEQQPALVLAPAEETSPPVSLSLESTDIATVLNMLADLGGVNIVSGPEVGGPVSFSIVGVPFEEALTSILFIGGFIHFRIGDIIYVTTAEQRMKLPPAARDLELRTYEINHADSAGILAAVNEFISEDGKAFMSEEDVLVVQDAPPYMATIDSLIASLDVPPQQVMITVKILRITHDDNLGVGVQFNPSFDNLDVTDVLTAGFARDLTNLGPGARGLFAGAMVGEERIFLEALDEKSDVEVLASPQLLALDGEQADIQVGDRLGFRITTVTETASLQSVQFLDVGVTMEVTPYIGSDGLIRMDIHPKVSTGEVDQTSGLPSESTTEASTMMMVENGQTVVIGGLINLQRQRVRSQVPILGDIPVLGLLFGRNTWIDQASELVILITPEIIGPGPTEGMMGTIDRVWGLQDKLSQRRSTIRKLIQ